MKSLSLRRFFICIDSKSTRESLKCPYAVDPLTKEIQQQTHYLLSRHYDVVFCWTLGHVGIVGNELADQAAKSATQKTTVDIHTVLVRDVQLHIPSMANRVARYEF